MSRSDDIIKPTEHRISTGSIEEAINEVSRVVESAAAGFDDDIRGDLPLEFVVLKIQSEG
jgi:propionyl-CoA synthetase